MALDNVEDWVAWAMRANLPADLIAFVRFRPALLFGATGGRFTSEYAEFLRMLRSLPTLESILMPDDKEADL